MFKPGPTATGENMNVSGNVLFTKRTLAGRMSGSWTQSDGIALAEDLCNRLGRVILA
jgi:hypothetical protein